MESQDTSSSTFHAIDPHNVHVVIAHYNEDTNWTHNLPYNAVLVSKQGIPSETPPNRGNEASCFLEYIIRNYDNLREITIFVHGHQNAWHHKKNMDESLWFLDISEHDYCNINDYIKYNLNKCEECTEAKLLLPQLFDILELPFEKKDVETIEYRLSAQFYVNRKTIMQYSKETYIKLYEWIMNSIYTSAYTGRMFEYIWHILFTRSLDDVNLQTYRPEVKNNLLKFYSV